MDLSKSSREFLNVSYGEVAKPNYENVGELPMGFINLWKMMKRVIFH